MYYKGVKVRKAVIAAAGMGTRFLPQTKAMPKEMLPIIDKPVIQYVVEELVDAGIEDIVIVTGSQKRSIEDHFDLPSSDLDRALRNGDEAKQQMLSELESIAKLANFIYLRQKGPQGNATPLLNAEHLIGNEPFIYTWGDEFIKSEPPVFKLMVQTHEEFNCPVVLTLPATNDEDYTRYGFYGGETVREGIVNVQQVVEKPGREAAPSQSFSVGGFLLTPAIFPYIHQLFENYDRSKEVIIQQAYQKFVNEGNQIIAAQIPKGRYYDTGNKLEYLKTVIDFGLQHPKIGPVLRDHLQKSLQEP